MAAGQIWETAARTARMCEDKVDSRDAGANEFGWGRVLALQGIMGKVRGGL